MRIIKQLLSNTMLLMVLFAALMLPIASMTLLKYRATQGGVLSATSRLVEYRDKSSKVQNMYQETKESTDSVQDLTDQWQKVDY